MPENAGEPSPGRADEPVPRQNPNSVDTRTLEGETIHPEHRPSIGRLGRFEVIRELGEGAHGIVYQARDPFLKRDVAVKVLRPELLISGRARKRFVSEGQLAASLDNANILKVFDAGEADGVCYIACEYCAAGTVRQWLDENERFLSPKVAAQIVAELADAVEHAHAQNILHRDLKPANLLLGPMEGARSVAQGGAADNLLAAARRAEFPFAVKLADFGVAKALDDTDARTVTLTGTIVGTASYMSPEQAAGRSREIGPRSDVYGLGAILFELLTRRPPFAFASYGETIQAVLTQECPPLKKLRPGIPGDLAAVCHKCLEKEMKDRYSTAAALADDLREFLADRPVKARPAGWVRRVTKAYRRQRQLIELLVGVFLAAWALTLVAAWIFIRAHSTEPVESGLDGTQNDAAYITNIRNAANVVRENRQRLRDHQSAADEMADVLKRDIPAAGQIDRRGFDWYYLWRLCHPRKVVGELRLVSSFRSHKDFDDVYFVTFSNDGSLLASAGRDKKAYVWNVETRKPLVECSGHKNDVNWVDFSPDEKRLATASDDGTVKIWDAGTGKELFTLTKHGCPVIAVLFARNGKDLLISADQKGVLKVWDLGTKLELKSIQAHSARIQSLDQGGDGRLLLTAGDDGKIRLWELPGLTLRGTQDNAGVHSAVLSPDGEMIIGAGGGTITVDDVRTGGRRIQVAAHTSLLESVRVSPDGTQIASCSGDGSLQLLDLPSRDRWTAARKRVYPDSKQTIRRWCIAYSRDGGRMATSCNDGLIEIWDTTVTPQWTKLALNTAKRNAVCMCFSADSSRLAVGSAGKPEGHVDLWDVSGRFPKQLGAQKFSDAPWSVAFSPDGNDLAATPVGVLALLDANTAKMKKTVPHPQWTTQDLTYNAGRLLGCSHLTGGTLQEVRVYDPATLAELPLAAGRIPSAEHMRLSGHGELLASFRQHSNQSSLNIYEVASGRPVWEHVPTKSNIAHVAFSPTEPLVAVALDDGVSLIDFKARKEVGFFEGLNLHTAIDFSADGKLLFVVSGHQAAMHILHVAQRKELFEIPLPNVATLQPRFWVVAVSPDGKKVACSIKNSDGVGCIYLLLGTDPESP